MPEHVELLELVRAAVVLDGVPLEPTSRGLRPAGAGGSCLISWRQVREALGPDAPADPAPRHRLELLVALTGVLAELGDEAPARLALTRRPLALPVGHPLHPGEGWSVARLPGGVLDLGIGVVGLLPGQAGPLPLPPTVTERFGLALPSAGWEQLWQRAERLGGLAGRHLAATGDQAVIRSAGGCDALTLAATGSLRDHLLGSAPAAALPVAAPRRDRVRIGDRADDRDRDRAVWLLSAAAERGVLEPLLATRAGVEPVSSAAAQA